MKLNKIAALLGFLFVFGPAHAQDGKNYKSSKKAIREAYMGQVREIAAKRNMPAHEKRKQRDAAIEKYKSDKRANRLAFRRSVDHNRSAFEKKNKGYVPRLHKN